MSDKTSIERKYWKFHGGVHPEFHKDMSTIQPISSLKLPKRLIIPVQQHIGAATEVLVNTGDKVFKGQVIAKMAEGELGASIHAPSSGVVGIIEKKVVAHPSAIDALCIELLLDGKDDWGDCQLEVYSDFKQCDHATLLARLEEAGLVGLGGAAFPSFIKVDSSTKVGLETLIINAAECEPYISCDDLLMRERADNIVIGIQILIKILQPKQCLIGIEDNKPQAIVAMQVAVNAVDENIDVISVPTLYPSGDAKILTKILTGIEIPKSKRSYDMGSLCHNLATVYAIYKAVVEGEPLISRIITLTGDGIKQPQNIEALIGTPVSDLVAQAGGYTTKAQRLIMGGPMMGFTLPHDDIPAIKASNCFLVSSITSLQQANSIHSSQAQMPCIRCGKCMEACPAELLPQQLYWHTQAKDFERVAEHHLNSCIECGCCDFVCPSHIPLVSYFRFAKSEIRAQQTALKKSDLSRQRHEFLEFRKIREKQERDEKRRKHKEALQKKKAAMAAKKTGGSDEKSNNPKVATIKAALARAKAKKLAREAEAKKDH
jgi:electron transport complex protein RnfC